jgi:hypothetical protein
MLSEFVGWTVLSYAFLSARFAWKNHTAPTLLLLQNFLIKYPHGQGNISGGAPPA